MARKPLDDTKMQAVEAIAKAAQEERNVESVARVEIERAVRARVAAARERTNAAVHRGVRTHGLSIAVTAEMGFNNQSRVNVYTRIDEYEAAHPEVVATGAGEGYVAPVAGLTVVREGSNLIVVFEHYSHIDLGDDINGSVVFDHEGNEISHEANLDKFYEAAPLWSLFVWQLPEVVARA